MKTFKTILKTPTYLIIASLLTFSISCSPEDGEKGEQGVAGQDGLDGNANVKTYTYDISSLNSSPFTVDIPELTVSTLENDVVLTYVERTDTNIGTTFFQVPGVSVSHLIEVELFPETINMYFYDRFSSNSLTPDLGTYGSLKVIIIESNVTNSNRDAKNSDIISKLKKAGVDIENYRSVYDYFNLDY